MNHISFVLSNLIIIGEVLLTLSSVSFRIKQQDLLNFGLDKVL